MERKRAVVAVIEKDGKVVLGKKIQNSQGTLRGEWHIPGETVEDSETDEQAIKRGMMEEMGINVDVVGFVASHTTPKGTEVNWYLCKTDEEELIIGSDLEDARWIMLGEVSTVAGELGQSLWPKEIQALFEKM